MWPTFIYELLPYLYSSVGIAAALNLDSPLGKFSGGLLFSAAVTIWSLRRYYRSFNQ